MDRDRVKFRFSFHSVQNSFSSTIGSCSFRECWKNCRLQQHTMRTSMNGFSHFSCAPFCLSTEVPGATFDMNGCQIYSNHLKTQILYHLPSYAANMVSQCSTLYEEGQCKLLQYTRVLTYCIFHQWLCRFVIQFIAPSLKGRLFWGIQFSRNVSMRCVCGCSVLNPCCIYIYRKKGSVKYFSLTGS